MYYGQWWRWLSSGYLSSYYSYFINPRFIGEDLVMNYKKWITKIERKEVNSMSLSEILIKLGGIVLFVVGLGLVLGAVGVPFLGVTFLSPLWSIVAGVIFMGAGIWVVRGGNITL